MIFSLAAHCQNMVCALLVRSRARQASGRFAHLTCTSFVRALRTRRRGWPSSWPPWGIGKIAIFHANDAFGRDARSHVEAALAANSMRLAGAQSYEPATVAVLPAATALKENWRAGDPHVWNRSGVREVRWRVPKDWRRWNPDRELLDESRRVSQGKSAQTFLGVLAWRRLCHPSPGPRSALSETTWKP